MNWRNRHDPALSPLHASPATLPYKVHGSGAVNKTVPEVPAAAPIAAARAHETVRKPWLQGIARGISNVETANVRKQFRQALHAMNQL